MQQGGCRVLKLRRRPLNLFRPCAAGRYELTPPLLAPGAASPRLPSEPMSALLNMLAPLTQSGSRSQVLFGAGTSVVRGT